MKLGTLNNVFKRISCRIFSDNAIVLTFTLVFLFRCAYVLFVIDPHSGQDAPSFSEDAKILVENGPFVPLIHAPWWPVGYSWFVSIWWGLFGVDSRALGLVQTTTLLIAQILFYRFARIVFEDRAAKIFAYLMLFNFALLSSSGQIMYEVPMASFLVLGCYHLKDLLLYGRWRMSSAFFSGFFFALSILMHPSALAPSLVLTAIAAWRRIDTRKIFLSLTISISLTISGALIQTARNAIAGDGLGFTSTAFSNASLGGWGGNDLDRALECSKIGKVMTGPRAGQIWDNPVRQACLYLVTSKSPKQVADVVLFNSKRYWSPLVGILKFNGTWYHGFDIRRFIDSWYVWWEGGFRKFDTLLSYLWLFFHLGLFAIGVSKFSGFLRGEFQRHMQVKLFLLSPIIISYLVSLLTLGDTRHRMPVMMFYASFVALGILHTTKKLTKSWLSSVSK
jgi:4-amino-4-deoxy-L-arabinose transferase-like glycosyltransferase